MDHEHWTDIENGSLPYTSPRRRIGSVLLAGLLVASCFVMLQPAYADDAPRFAAGGAFMLSPAGSTRLVSDGHGPEARQAQAIGLEGEALLSVIPHVQVGVGARYSFSQITELGARGQGHRLSMPLLIVGSLGLDSGSALELRFGLGYGVALFSGYGNAATTGGSLSAYGRTTEVLLGYVYPLSSRVAATTHLGVQVAKLQAANGDPSWEDAHGDSVALVVNVGVRRR